VSVSVRYIVIPALRMAMKCKWALLFI